VIILLLGFANFFIMICDFSRCIFRFLIWETGFGSVKEIDGSCVDRLRSSVVTIMVVVLSSDLSGNV